jgi:2-C-methyl-D-erythritol 4-phosphate cytidylyltransferase
MNNPVAVIVAAAGTGSRMGTDINKQYLLLRGRPLLSYALDIFERAEMVTEIVVVTQEQELEYCREKVIAPYGYQKISGLVPGGARRQDSVWAGLQHITKKTGLVAVHDGARPFITELMLKELLEEGKRWGAAIPGRPALETLKLVDRELMVEKTLDRSLIWSVQTPQVFHYDSIVKAYREAEREGFGATDDAALYERYIGRVKIVPGDDDNIKITTWTDLSRAEVILENRQGKKCQASEEFSSIAKPIVSTKHWKFDREEANERR